MCRTTAVQASSKLIEIEDRTQAAEDRALPPEAPEDDEVDPFGTEPQQPFNLHAFINERFPDATHHSAVMFYVSMADAFLHRGSEAHMQRCVERMKQLQQDGATENDVARLIAARFREIRSVFGADMSVEHYRAEQEIRLALEDELFGPYHYLDDPDALYDARREDDAIEAQLGVAA